MIGGLPQQMTQQGMFPVMMTKPGAFSQGTAPFYPMPQQHEGFTNTNSNSKQIQINLKDTATQDTLKLSANVSYYPLDEKLLVSITLESSY